jgi:predicted NBD/HSP70 family sugar kinase
LTAAALGQARFGAGKGSRDLVHFALGAGVGGGVAAAGDLPLNPARPALRQHAYPGPCGQARIVRSALGPDTGLFGAAALVLALVEESRKASGQ